jgi:hypothetical protein
MTTATVSQNRTTTTIDLEPAQESSTVLHIVAGDLESHPVPPEDPRGYVAALSAAGLGTPRYVNVRRVNGKPADRIVLDYENSGSLFERVWVAQRSGSRIVDYSLQHDTSSTGYVSA